MAQPNFFIIGAPKCGTTALSEYLRSHPNIYISDPKEPHYFATDFPKHRLVQTVDEYLELFNNINQNHVAVGEASVWYLYSEVALENIYHFNPQAKIIVMLRNPVEMIPSLHSQALYNRNESETKLECAWDLQWERGQGLNLPHLCREPKVLQYAKIAKFGEQIERLLTIFPTQQIHIVWYEDFASSTQKVYEDILAFLGVPSDGKTNFERVNVNKFHRFGFLGELSEKPPHKLVEIAMTAKKLLGIERLYFLDSIRKINKREKPREPISNELRLKLSSEFRDDINKLSQILDKDLKQWKTLETVKR